METEKPDEKSARAREPRENPFCVSLSVALIAWVGALVVYFLHKEGLYSLTFGRFGFAPSEHAGVYQAVLANIWGGYHIWWSNIPWNDLAIAAGVLFLLTLLGVLCVSCFEVYMPNGALLSLGLACGCGVAGVAFELVTMAGLLTQQVVITTWVVLAVLLVYAWLIARNCRRPRGAGGTMVSPRLRSAGAEHWIELCTAPVTGVWERLYLVAAWVLIWLISVLVFLHAVGEPETYWDSLILYMGYARKMFLEHKFPLKVVGQVGIGLGANYPHLYALLTAQTAAIAGHWSDMFAQLLPPAASLATVLLVYYTALSQTRQPLIAVSAALLVRAVPYGICYGQYASDYALAVMFTAAFLYVALRYVQDGLRGYLWLMLLLPAFAVHVNYLMLVLWPSAFVFIALAHLPWRASSEPQNDEVYQPIANLRPPAFMVCDDRVRLLRVFFSSWLWVPLIVGVVVAAPWFVRNTVVTGNPVYAFFYNIFPSRNVNPEVMRSASVEWLNNGDGLGRAGRTLGEKLTNSWAYFVTSPQHWKLAPVFMAFVVPGFLFVLGATLVSLARRRRLNDELRFALGAAFLFGVLWFYAYAIADYYLYQIIIVLPLFGVFAAALLESIRPRNLRTPLYVACLIIGIAPGVLMGLMGFKLKTSGIMAGGKPFSQVELTALKNLFMERDTFLRMVYNGDMSMFSWINGLPTGRGVLTHENRHLLLDERIRIMQLDDWEVQAAYGKPAEERVRILDGLGVDYYLYVPNEDNHRINSKLGMDELIGAGYYKQTMKWPSSRGSTREALHGVDLPPDLSGELQYKHIPPDANTLYKRVSLK